MRIHVLLHRLRPRATLRSALKVRAGRLKGPELHFDESWTELLDAAQRGITDVAVVDPWDGEAEPGARRNLCLLLNRLGRERVVLYLSPTLSGSAGWKDLADAGVGGVLVEGVDDDPGHVLQVLGEASARAFLRRIDARLQDRLDRRQREFFLEVLASAVGCRQVSQLARRLGLTLSDLRAELKALGLVAPRGALRWARLGHAIALRSIGVHSATRISFHVGYGDAASVCRLYRELLGCPAGELPRDQAAEIVASALMNQLTLDRAG